MISLVRLSDVISVMHNAHLITEKQQKAIMDKLSSSGRRYHNPKVLLQCIVDAINENVKQGSTRRIEFDD